VPSGSDCDARGTGLRVEAAKGACGEAAGRWCGAGSSPLVWSRRATALASARAARRGRQGEVYAPPVSPAAAARLASTCCVSAILTCGIVKVRGKAARQYFPYCSMHMTPSKSARMWATKLNIIAERTRDSCCSASKCARPPAGAAAAGAAWPSCVPSAPPGGSLPQRWLRSALRCASSAALRRSHAAMMSSATSAWVWVFRGRDSRQAAGCDHVSSSQAHRQSKQRGAAFTGGRCFGGPRSFAGPDASPAPHACQPARPPRPGPPRPGPPRPGPACLVLAQARHAPDVRQLLHRGRPQVAALHHQGMYRQLHEHVGRGQRHHRHLCEGVRPHRL
jgi:hypothetical protein